MVENQQKQNKDIDARLQGEEAKLDELQRLASGSDAHGKQQHADLDDQKPGGAPGSQAERRSDQNNQRINLIMKDEQENFAYDDLDHGSNKSFSSNSVEKAAAGNLMLNMEQLVQNPGRAS